MERTTLLNAEYALQTAAAAIYRDLDEVDDLASWCAYNPSMRTYLLTDSAGNNQALSMYPTLTSQVQLDAHAGLHPALSAHQRPGRQMMFGTAATNAVTLTPDTTADDSRLQLAQYGWDCISSATRWP